MKKSNRFKYYGLIFLSVLFGLTTSVISLLIFHLVSEVAKDNVGDNDLIYFFILLLSFLLSSSLSSFVASEFTSRLIKKIRSSLVDRIISSPFSTIEKIGTHQLHIVLTHDVNLIAAALKELPTLIYNLILLIACLGYLLYLSPAIFTGMVSLIFFAAILDSIVIKMVSNFSYKRREQQDILMKGLYGLTDGVKQLILNSSRKEDYIENDLKINIERVKDLEQKHSFLWDVNRNVNQFLIFVILAVVVLLGHTVGQSENILNYLVAVTFLSGPFRYIIGYWPDVASAIISIKKIKSLNLQSDDEVNYPIKRSNENIFLNWSTLRLKNVSFDYSNGFILYPFNLDINRGEVIFVKGHNGSGKSTFLHILLGLYQPSTGMIYLDGSEVDDRRIYDYRNQMGVVLHEFKLFSSLLGKAGRKPQNKEINALLEFFHLSRKVRINYFKVEEGKLSKGQRKRLALLSEILEEKEIYVLDEWAAEQDPDFRREFYEKVIPWLKSKGKTVVAVTHDESYYCCADKVLEFSEGKLREIVINH